MNKTICESLNTPISYECDVLVAGGGFAGIAAALAAARSGKKVILAERQFVLGGLGTAGLVTIYLPLCDGLGHQVSFGLAEELLRLSIDITHDDKRGISNWVLSDDPSKRTEKDPRFAVNFNPHLFAMRAEQVLTEQGVKILYGTYAVATAVEDEKIKAAIMENKSGRFGICAASYIDATGDADLVKFSGAPTKLFGVENKLAAWYYFVTGSDRPQLKMYGAADIPDEEKEKDNAPQQIGKKRYGGIDGDEISSFVQTSHQEILKDIQRKRESDPTYEPVQMASIPQLRMTRRIDGAYTLDDTEMHTFFPDSIGMVSDWRKRGPVYEVPFRTLYTEKIKNLLCAGRCTSVTNAMWDIMRVIPCCSVTGEAAGVAAAMSDDFTALDIEALQKELIARGVVLHEKDLP